MKKLVDAFFDLTASSSVTIDCFTLRVRNRVGRLQVRAQAYRDIDALPIYVVADKRYLYYKSDLKDESFMDITLAFYVLSSVDRWELHFILHPLPLPNMYRIDYVVGHKLDATGEWKVINEAETDWFSAYNRGD